MMKQKKTRIIQALILDDELEACRNIHSILRQYWPNTIDILGIAQSTQDAERIMTQIQPDVLFIDIEMPGENAFQFLERIGSWEFEIIFVTAYDEYALRALKLNAVDYILKPISVEELGLAIQKLKEKLTLKEISKRFAQKSITSLIDQIHNKSNPEKLILRYKTEMLLLDFKDIHYIEAEGSYAHFYFNERQRKKDIIMSQPLSTYEELLPKELFYRIHKSYLVNCTYIKKIIKEDQTMVELKDGKLLSLSRRRYTDLLDFLKRHHFS